MSRPIITHTHFRWARLTQDAFELFTVIDVTVPSR